MVPLLSKVGGRGIVTRNHGCNVPVGMYPFPGRNVPLPRLVSPRQVSGNTLLARESFHTWPALL